MKTKCSVLTVLLVLFIAISGISQEIDKKNFNNSDKSKGGDIILKSSIVKIEGTKALKIFEFESPGNGNYYLNAWLMGAELDGFKSEKYVEYELTVNNEKQEEKFKPSKSNWHNASYKEKKCVKLKEGLNHIIFSCETPGIPDIEFICLSKNKDKSEISESSYGQFVSEIKKDVQARIKNPKPKNDSIASTLKSGIVLDNPEGDYGHKLNINFRYTTYKFYNINQGSQFFITTHADDNYYHVLELFVYSAPEGWSWSTLSNSSGMASLNINAPVTATYCVRIRSYQQETQGLVDLNVNGEYYFSDCPVSGSGVAFPHETPTTYDYFTAN